jgi:hypothetical protein
LQQQHDPVRNQRPSLKHENPREQVER